MLPDAWGGSWVEIKFYKYPKIKGYTENSAWIIEEKPNSWLIASSVRHKPGWFIH